MTNKEEKSIMERIKLLSRPRLLMISGVAVLALGGVAYSITSLSKPNTKPTEKTEVVKDFKGTPEVEQDAEKGLVFKDVEKKESVKSDDIAESVLGRYKVNPIESSITEKKSNPLNLLLAKTELETLEKEVVSTIENKPAVVETVRPETEIPIVNDNDNVETPGTEIPDQIISTPVVEISSQSEIILLKGDDFDLTNYYRVSDGIDAFPLVRIMGSVDMNTVGSRSVTIQATNKFGNQAQKTLNFYVNSPSEFSRIKDTNDIMVEDDKFNPMSYVSAKHHLDGDISNKIEIIKDDMKINKEGTYEIEYKVVDSKATPSFFSVEFMVTNHAPKMTNVKDKTIEVGSELTKEMLTDGIKVSDREDDYFNRPIDIKLSGIDIETLDTSEENSYEVSYIVTDSHGKEVVKKAMLHIVDSTPEEPTPPVEEGENTEEETVEEETAETVVKSARYTVSRSNEARVNTEKTYSSHCFK